MPASKPMHIAAPAQVGNGSSVRLQQVVRPIDYLRPVGYQPDNRREYQGHAERDGRDPPNVRQYLDRRVDRIHFVTILCLEEELGDADYALLPWHAVRDAAAAFERIEAVQIPLVVADQRFSV